MKLKMCNGCKKPVYIWKSVGKEKFCKICWFKQSPITKIKSKPKRISPRSEKRIIADKKYGKLRKKFLESNPMCMAKFSVCISVGCQVHHTFSGKDRNSHLLDIESWWSICSECHRYGHDKLSLEEAINIGFKQI